MKEYLSRKGIEFTERDVTRDPSAIQDLQRMGILSTPLTVIDGQTVLGFNARKLDSLLADS